MIAEQFFHLCIIEKRRPTSVIKGGKGNGGGEGNGGRGGGGGGGGGGRGGGGGGRESRLRVSLSAAVAWHRCRLDLADFARFGTFWSIRPLGGVPGQKF